ncbi:hypothetical protein ABWH96_01770 [Marivirga tractuosa]|uniref:hypothetical protein n=1 Tax=Marivirga tractuosa TaxID=1006 RepID=UPI0035D00364
MKNFINQHKKVLTACIILGLILFTYDLIDYYLITGSQEEAPNNTHFLKRAAFWIPLMLIVSIEFLAKKEWKKAIIITMAVFVYALFKDYIINNIIIDQWEEFYWTISVINSFLGNTLVFLIIRYILLKIKFNWLAVFISGYLITILINYGFRISSIELLDANESTATIIKSISLFTVFWPLFFWVSVYVLDAFIIDHEWRKEYINIEIPINSLAYKQRIFILIIIQSILLFIIIQHVFTNSNLNAFDTSINVGLITCFLITTVLIYIQSLKRTSTEQRSPSFIYLFFIPVLNIIPALILSRNNTNSSETPKKEFVFKDKLEYCKNCKNKFFDFKKGLVCGLTKEKPSFVNECPDFSYQNYDATSLTHNPPKSLLVIQRIVLALFLIVFIILAITKLNSGFNNSMVTIFMIVLNLVLQIGIIIAIWNLKKWALLVLLGLIYINIVTQLTMSGMSVSPIPYLSLFCISYLLITVNLPLWSYMTGFEKKKIA